MSNVVIAIAVTVVIFAVVVRSLVISIPDFVPPHSGMTAGMAWRIFRCTIIPDNNGVDVAVAVVGMAILFSRRDLDSPLLLLLLLVPSLLLRRPAAATAFAALPREFRLQRAIVEGISLGFPHALRRPDAHRDRIVVYLVVQQSLFVTLLQYPKPSIVQ